MLLVKPKSVFLRRLFSIQSYWLFTIFLLTVPFRIHFARHCDELHVTLVKETSATAAKEESVEKKESWLTSSGYWLSFKKSFTQSKSVPSIKKEHDDDEHDNDEHDDDEHDDEENLDSKDIE